MKAHAALVAALLLGCERSPEPPQPRAERGPDAAASAPATARWELRSDDDAATLLFGAQRIQLICPRRGEELLVNVPAFRAIGSEERLSLGGGGEVVALVADTAGDPRRGGVTASGAVPKELGRLLSGGLSARYGNQVAGPFPAPPAEVAQAFLAACLAPSAAPAPPPPQQVSACLVQDGGTLPKISLRAIGTEPFWGAGVTGRCVTYSTPENQAETRIWSRFEGTAERGSWTGFYEQQRFVMRTRPQPGCSDGMSDKSYPIAVSLTVAGEERRGCAERR